jgi:hypothetical protein
MRFNRNYGNRCGFNGKMFQIHSTRNWKIAEKFTNIFLLITKKPPHLKEYKQRNFKIEKKSYVT